MTQAALIEALRRNGERDAQALWEEARARAQAHKDDAARSLEEQRRQIDAEIAANAAEFEREAVTEAQREARRIHVQTSTALAGRLFRLACASLPRFRQEHYEQLFAALAAELPARTWQRVRVNPADQRLAAARFPPAQVECDEAIVGGIEVEAEDGRVRISNTLQTRLQMAWPDILPGLIHHILSEASHEQSAA
jgi:vacuolar-type H+-ATPase subunit E/Vma4